ncbi:MAG TPA: type IV pilus secretin PilQ, partial [Thermoanaerobaculia bacterium]|nr:type IV pilus secretin PilQ [Thermoanaerobaculia bacterium]
MSRGKRTLLVTTTLLLAAHGLYAGLWRSRKPQPSTKAPVAAVLSLTSVDADATRITLHTSGTPAYTSYSPSPGVFVVDLTGANRTADVKIPATLPAPVTSVTAEEVTEMGNGLTRVTFRLAQPVTPEASASGNNVIVTLPTTAIATTEAPAPAVEKPVETALQQPAAQQVVQAPAPVTLVEQAPVVEPLPPTKAKSVRRVTTTGEGQSFAIDIAGDGAMSAYKAFRLNNPERLVIDIAGVKDRVAKAAMEVNDGLVKRVRVAQFQPEVTRVVVDLSSKSEYAITPTGHKLRITFGENAKIAKATPAPVAPKPIKIAAAADVPSQVPTIAEDATWKLPGGAKPVINAPEDQTPPATPPQATTAPRQSTNTTTPMPAPARGNTAENVFDDAAQSAQAPTAANAATTMGGTRTLSGAQRVFTGDPISLNLKDADIKDVIRTFAQLTGLNIAVDPDVSGTVTVDFVDVPWDQALDLILRQNNLTFVLEGNVMRVGHIDRLAQETQAAARLAEQERLNVPLTTLSFKLSYARAGEVAGLLRDLASPRARIIVDQRTNQLIISEIPQYLQTMRNLIDTVDIPNRQVVIEARIVETTKTFSLQYGFSWNFGGVLDPALGTGTGLIFPNRVGFTGGPFSFTGGGANVLGLTFSDVLGSFNLDFALAASEAQTLVRVVSAPKVTTQDNNSAEIQSGVQIPYQTRVNFTTTVNYIDATLRLSVTPQITEAGTIIMDIAVQKTTPGQPIEGAAGTPLNTRTARTRVMVRDGGTAVIGGIYQASDTSSQSGVPVLKDIPVLGALFRSHSENKQNDELLIFVTPRI